jgi:SAM-dependent methyltransferase
VGDCSGRWPGPQPGYKPAAGLAAAGPSTPAELAARTQTSERYVAEWLRGQAAGGYVTYDPATGRYLLSEEQAFDYHDRSIEWARKAAAEAGVSDRCAFEVAPADAYPGDGYDLVAIFDALHDMGDPLAAATHVRRSLAEDGTFLLVEPAAGERVEDNLNPVGRIFYSASLFICVPNARSQGGQGLGSQVSEAAWRQLLAEAGFGRVRRATETPFNRVFEARP